MIVKSREMVEEEKRRQGMMAKWKEMGKEEVQTSCFHFLPSKYRFRVNRRG